MILAVPLSLFGLMAIALSRYLSRAHTSVQE